MSKNGIRPCLKIWKLKFVRKGLGISAIQQWWNNLNIYFYYYLLQPITGELFSPILPIMSKKKKSMKIN